MALKTKYFACEKCGAKAITGWIDVEGMTHGGCGGVWLRLVRHGTKTPMVAVTEKDAEALTKARELLTELYANSSDRYLDKEIAAFLNGRAGD